MKLSLPPAPAVPGLKMSASTLFPFPEDARAWLRATLVEGTPPWTIATSVAALDLSTVDGWPASLVEAEVTRGEERETRVVVLYRFLSFAGGAVARLHARAAYLQSRDAIVQVLERGAPDFSGQGILSLHELFGGRCCAARENAGAD